MEGSGVSESQVSPNAQVFPPRNYKPPTTEKQAATYPDAQRWHSAELTEKQSLLKTGTFEYM